MVVCFEDEDRFLGQGRVEQQRAVGLGTSEGRLWDG